MRSDELVAVEFSEFGLPEFGQESAQLTDKWLGRRGQNPLRVQGRGAAILGSLAMAGGHAPHGAVSCREPPAEAEREVEVRGRHDGDSSRHPVAGGGVSLGDRVALPRRGVHKLPTSHTCSSWVVTDPALCPAQ